MGINRRLLSSTNSGQGGGANLVVANLLSPASGQPVTARTIAKPAASLADAYHLDGVTDFRPWDLLAWGSPGAAIATAKGYRYLWIFNNDHGTTPSGSEGGWGSDSQDTYAGFSNDPHVPPEASTLQSLKPNFTTISALAGYEGFAAWMVYNPDDATNPFYMYCEGGNTSAALPNALPGVCYKTSDFDTPFTGVSVSHACTGTFGLTAYQRVYRLGTGDWISFGGGNPAANDGTYSKWTSTDGITFTNGSLIKKQVNSSGTAVTGAVSNGWQKSFGMSGERFQIGSDWYLPCVEDLRGPGWSSGTTYAANEQVNVNQVTYRSIAGSNLNNPPASSPGQWTNLGVLGQYVTLVPVDGTTGDINITGTPPIIRVSDRYNGNYPDATYLQYVTSYVEDGICHCYALHGFFNDTGLPAPNQGKLPEDGGGLNEQFIDLYAYVFDDTAARDAAPLGVTAKCVSGVVTLSWHNIPAGRTYRVKRGTDGVTFGTNLGDFTATTMTDSPTVGSVYYYQVIALDAGTEKGSRVVSTYVS